MGPESFPRALSQAIALLSGERAAFQKQRGSPGLWDQVGQVWVTQGYDVPRARSSPPHQRSRASYAQSGQPRRRDLGHRHQGPPTPRTAGSQTAIL